MIDSTVRLVGANGTSVTLLDSADELMREPGGAGWGMAPVINSWFEGAGDGELLRGTRRTNRELVIPISAFGMSRAGVEQQLRRLVGAIRAPFRVFIDYDDGRSYYVNAVYEAGASGQYGANPNRRNQMPIVLKADPYWTSVQAQSFTIKPASGEPFLPELSELHVSSSVAQGQVTVTNTGDVESRPTWTIHGPGSGLSITMDGRGLVFPDLILTASDVITIEFVDGGWSVTNQLGQNMYTHLGPAPWFIEFPPGTSIIDVEMADATPETFIQAIYPERREVMY